jgi:hypothetical protein
MTEFVALVAVGVLVLGLGVLAAGCLVTAVGWLVMRVVGRRGADGPEAPVRGHWPQGE